MHPEINTALMTAYCERTLPGLWQEPLNAFTNLAFIITGILAIRLYKKNAIFDLKHHWDFVILIALLFAIGLGSALWHFLPTRFTILADVIPILLFINIYLLSFLFRVVACGWKLTVLFYLLFLLLNIVVSVSFRQDFLNGSVFYGPGWITLLVISGYLLAVKHPLRKRLLAAAAIFTVSLLFRTVDRDVCQWVPEGTHFIWHLLNAWLLYLLTGALFSHQADVETKRRLSKP